MKTDIAIIGAGHNALVAATYLARAGLKVHLFERRNGIGGAALSEELWPGYTFSTGAHLLWAVPDTIMRDLRLKERGLRVLPREAPCFLHGDGTYHADPSIDQPNNVIARSKLTPDEVAGLERYQQFKTDLFDLVRPFVMRTPPSLDELRKRAAGTRAAEALELATTLTLWEVQDRFLPTARLREAYAHEASPVTANPRAFVLTYNALGLADPSTGREPLFGFVQGGMQQLSNHMAAAAREAGALIHLDRPVRRILTANGRVSGLELADGTQVEATTVLSTADPKVTFLRLLTDEQIDPELRRRIAGLVTHVSCCKLLAAVTELPRWPAWDGDDPDTPNRGSMQFDMTRDIIRECYGDIAAGRPARRPMMCVNIPSMFDPSLAPPGHHTVSIWIYPAPSKLGDATWSARKETIKAAIIDYITGFAPNFRDSIVHSELETPEDLESKLALTDGCIWHLQHNPDQLMAGRPLPELSHYRSPLAGLYLGGAGQHPGGEVSGVPGHNAAHEILADLNRG